MQIDSKTKASLAAAIAAENAIRSAKGQPLIAGSVVAEINLNGETGEVKLVV